MEKMFSAGKIVFLVVEKTIGVSPKLFSEAEKLFFASENSFFITKKIVGEAPTVNCEKPEVAHAHNALWKQMKQQALQ